MRRSVAQITPFDAIVSLQPISAGLKGLDAIATQLYSSAPDIWREFEPVRKKTEEAIRFLQYEGTIASETLACDALKVLFDSLPDTKNPLMLAVTHADQALGRKTIMHAFST